MMDKSKEAKSVRVEEHGSIVGHHFLYSKYRTLSYGLTLNKGHYSALFNNCQHFVFRFFNQVSTPGGVKDITEWPSIARELWFSGMNPERKTEILGKIRRNELSVSLLLIMYDIRITVAYVTKVEFLLEFLLMKGATAATDGLAKDAATAAEAAARTQTVAEAAAAEVGEMIKAAEKAVKAAQAAAEMAKATAEVDAPADGQDVTDVEAAIAQAAEAEAAVKAEAMAKAEVAAKAEAAAKAEVAAKARDAAKVAVDAATVLAEIANAVAKKADTMAKEAAIAKAAAEAHLATAESAAWMTQALAKNGA
jgi:hypothetical protein